MVSVGNEYGEYSSCWRVEVLRLLGIVYCEAECCGCWEL